MSVASLQTKRFKTGQQSFSQNRPQNSLSSYTLQYSTTKIKHIQERRIYIN